MTTRRWYPRSLETRARPIPVLPDDGSRIVAPGFSVPSRSASSTILSAIRSFEEPPGFCPSSLAHMRTSGFGESACTPTSGVLPIKPRTSSWRVTRSRAAGDGREYREHVAVADLGVEAVEVTDVVIVLVDVHELVQAALVVEQVGPQPGVLIDEVVEHLADRRAVDLD